MFFDTGGYRQHVGIEDDVFGREAVFGQQFVGAAGDRDFPFESIGLTLFVEQHYDGPPLRNGGSVRPGAGTPAPLPFNEVELTTV